MSEPRVSDDPLYNLLRHGEIERFNDALARGQTCDLAGTDLRGVDLRRLQAKGLDLSGCYLRQADLRGLDLSETNLRHASISGAKISGTLFPTQLSAEEINLSLSHGTRMRYR
jgi:uncharacterized protein YjbI with pentapeptide repeats